MTLKVTTDTATIPGLIVAKKSGEPIFVFDAWSVIALTPGYEDPVDSVQVSFKGWTRTVPGWSIGDATKALTKARKAGENRYINQQAKASIASKVKRAEA